MSAGGLAAGGAAPDGVAAGRLVTRSRCCIPTRPRDRHTDPTIRRKLTDRERRWLDDLFDRLDRSERRLQDIAWRHQEPI